MLKYQLPNIYKKLLPESLLSLEKNEILATCNNCAKAQPNEPKPFNPNLKCCTFYPFLPNYLVGELLNDFTLLEEDTKKIINQIFSENKYALPIGVTAPISYQSLYSQRGFYDYGNREEFLCPYYHKENGNCRIWRHRNSDCATYFCKSVDGKEGQDFWKSLQKYLRDVEKLLSAHAMKEQGYSDFEIERSLNYIEKTSGSQFELQIPTLHPDKVSLLWGKYAQQQKDFYLKSFVLISKLDVNYLNGKISEASQLFLSRFL